MRVEKDLHVDAGTGNVGMVNRTATGLRDTQVGLLVLRVKGKTVQTVATPLLGELVRIFPGNVERIGPVEAGSICVS